MQKSTPSAATQNFNLLVSAFASGSYAGAPAVSAAAAAEPDTRANWIEVGGKSRPHP
jgi:hypothetical protein